jgi:muconate cycloisomerase
LRIVELTAYQVRVPLRRPIRHALHSRTETDNVVVRCVLEDRTEGYGEGVPRDYVTGETIDSCIDLLRHSDLPAQLEDCADFPHAVHLAEGLRLRQVPGDDRQCQGNAARCAVELAVLDAYGRHFGQPLSAVTQLVAPDRYRPSGWVRYSGFISARSARKDGFYALVMRLYGFPNVKLMVGVAGHDDSARVRALRRWLGRRMDIRVDANEAWSAAEAVERIRALEPYKLSAVEQPVPHAEVAALRQLRREIKPAIMLDESLCSRVDAERAVADQTCDLFNLRLSKCGGFIPTLRLAQLAAERGLGCQLGCQVGETAILSAAGRHFAASVAELRYVEGSYDRHLVRAMLATEDITFRRGGWAPALAAPGLGITLDAQALAAVTLRKEPLL